MPVVFLHRFPYDIPRCMQEFEKKDFAKILKKNALEAHRWMKETDSTAARVYDRNIEAFPVTVELYGSYARIVDYADGGMADDDVTVMKDLVSRFLYIEHDRIVYVTRRKREGREQHGTEDSSLVIEVKENGLLFECELLRYVDTGLFLDQAHTRAMIRDLSAGMRVLNLFSYTGSFSVYAAAGGAESVTSVDLSNVYTAWARRNLDRNGFLDKEKYRTEAGDAREYLERCAADGERFDIVIFDPPAFSNSHKAEDFDVAKDYMWYLHAISAVLAPGGCVLFSENLSGFSFAKEALKPYWKIKEITADIRALGFAAKRNALRVWWMKKVADMEVHAAPEKRRKKKMDEEKMERLEIDAAAEMEERMPREEKKEGAAEERRRSERPERRRDGEYRGRGAGRDRDRGYSRRDERGWRDEKPRWRDDRPRRYADERPRWSDERPRYSDSRRDERGYRDERPRWRDDRPRRHEDERPRRSDERSRYSDSRRDERGYRDERPRWRDEGPRWRSDRDDYRPRRERDDWDNDTGRAYRSSRYSDDRRPPRYGADGNDRRPFGRDERRRKAPPKPYGYDDFNSTRRRDTSDYFWLKNTEVQKYDDEGRDKE